jgi:hypothetical protein
VEHILTPQIISKWSERTSAHFNAGLVSMRKAMDTAVLRATKPARLVIRPPQTARAARMSPETSTTTLTTSAMKRALTNTTESPPLIFAQLAMLPAFNVSREPTIPALPA